MEFARAEVYLLFCTRHTHEKVEQELLLWRARIWNERVNWDCKKRVFAWFGRRRWMINEAICSIWKGKKVNFARKQDIRKARRRNMFSLACDTERIWFI